MELPSNRTNKLEPSDSKITRSGPWYRVIILTSCRCAVLHHGGAYDKRDSCISNVCSVEEGWVGGPGNHFVNMDPGLSSLSTHMPGPAIFRSAKGGILHIQHF